MRKIDINESHTLLLSIAKVFDKICTEHDIPYYMLGGTMLGAIRHKGFIPWDDDMDFGVPRPFYNKLIEVLEKELPYPYKCCTFINCDAVKTPFLKIADTRTFIDDPRVKLPIEKQIGLNVDIFPLDYCDIKDPSIKKIYRLRRIFQLIYIDSTKNNWFKSSVKFMLRLLIPVEYKKVLRKINQFAESLNKGEYLANVFGRWKSKEIIPISWYGIGTRYKYEDITLCGLYEYDKYLNQMYGDYMKLPPIDKRDPHANNVYINE